MERAVSIAGQSMTGKTATMTMLAISMALGMGVIPVPTPPLREHEEQDRWARLTGPQARKTPRDHAAIAAAQARQAQKNARRLREMGHGR